MSGLAGLLNQATPGPWVAWGIHVNGAPEKFPRGNPAVATCHGNVYPTDGEANARLVALAPEMAALLTDAMAFLNAGPVTERPGESKASALVARFDQLNQKAAQ